MIAFISACLALAMQPAHADQDHTSPKTDILGQWCGHTDEWQYRWIHILNEDGTFSTYFESLEEVGDNTPPYWKFGTWTIEGRFFTEAILTEQTVGDLKEPVIPPVIHTYEIIELSHSVRELYNADWDTVFVSTRNCDPLLG